LVACGRDADLELTAESTRPWKTLHNISAQRTLPGEKDKPIEGIKPAEKQK